MEVDIMQQDLVKVIEGQVVVDSREVAKNFGKAHGDVLKNVDVLVRKIPLLKICSMKTAANIVDSSFVISL